MRTQAGVSISNGRSLEIATLRLPSKKKGHEQMISFENLSIIQPTETHLGTALRIARLRRRFGLSEPSARLLAAQVWETHNAR